MTQPLRWWYSTHRVDRVQLPKRFPFVADILIDNAGRQQRQAVRVLEHFGNRYRVEMIEPTKIPGLRRRLAPGVTMIVPTLALARCEV